MFSNKILTQEHTYEIIYPPSKYTGFITQLKLPDTKTPYPLPHHLAGYTIKYHKTKEAEE
jgi:hypothetical protein